MSKHAFGTALTTAALVVSSVGVAAATPVQPQAGTSIDPPAGAVGFGYALAADGTQVLVSAPRTTVAGRTAAGAAYVYPDNVRTPPTRLVAGDPGARAEFGFSADISGELAVVGAPYADGGLADTGAVYVFRGSGSGWRQEAKLTVPGAAALDRFGASVAVDGDTIAVHAPGVTTAMGVSAGRTYVYVDVAGGWTLEQTIDLGDAPEVGYRDSGQLALSGDTLVIGAAYEDVGGRADAGAVHVLERTVGSWHPRARLTAPTPVAGANLGSSVDLAADALIAGAPHAPARNGGEQGGVAVVFAESSDGWQVTGVLAPPSTGYDVCGLSVTILGDTAAVGCAYDDNASGLTDAGAVVGYTRSAGEWAQIQVLRSPQPGHRALFGRSVQLRPDGLAVGADVDRGAGAVYVFGPRPG